MRRRLPHGSRPFSAAQPHAPVGPTAWTCRSAIAIALALALAAIGTIAGAAGAPSGPTIALRFYDDDPWAQGAALAPRALREVELAAGFALSSSGRDADGAFLVVPAAPVPDAQLRSALVRLRSSGALVYAEPVRATAKRLPAVDAAPARALLVRMKPAAGHAARAEIRARIAVKLGADAGETQVLGGDTERVVLSRTIGAADAAALVAQIASHPDVLHAEVERRAQPQAVPTDPMFASQWNLIDAVGGINAPGAWQRTAGEASTPIAVLDTGVLPHPELAARLLPGYDMVAQRGFAGDGDGRDADPSDPGDFVTPTESADPRSPLYGCAATASTWHGTMVAGIVGAAANDGAGLVPVNWHSPILDVRVMGKCGGALADIADGIRWAAGLDVPGTARNATPARVINLSLSGHGECGAILQSAVTAALSAGATIVAATGNDNADAADRWPANCRGVIAAGGTSKDGTRSFFSNFGETVAVSAPAGGAGGSIPVLRNAGPDRPSADGYGYGQQVGTSLAAPHVAGAVSLVQALAPDLAPAEVRAILETTARPSLSPECAALGCGAGIVDAAAAVDRAATGKPGPAPVVPPPEPRPVPPSPWPAPPAPPPESITPPPHAGAPPPMPVPVPGGWTAKAPEHVDRLLKAGVSPQRGAGTRATTAASGR